MIPQTGAGLVWNGSAWQPMEWPWLIYIIPIGGGTVMQGAWNVFGAGTSNALMGGGLFNTTAANGDEVGWDIAMAPGTWNIGYTGQKNTGDGIVSIRLDGVEKASFDGFNSGPLYNSGVVSSDFVVATGGKKRLSIKLNGKNPSSTGFIAACQLITVRRVS